MASTAEEATPMRYDTSRDMKTIKTRQGNIAYLGVKGRVAWLRAEHRYAQIVTEKVDGGIEAGWVEFKCTITIPDQGLGPGAIATGHASETHQDFPDFYEKAETKAIGRACAALGYGTEGARDFDDGEPLDGAAASKEERANRRMDPRERQQVDQQHERNTGASNLHQHAQLRSIAEHGFDLAPRLAALGVETIEELSREQAMELIVAGRQSVRGEGNAPTAPPRQPAPSTLPATRNHPQQPDGQDRARANIEEKMAARGLPVLPMDTYAEIAETVDNALKAARCEARVQPSGRDGEVRPGDILNALMALPSAVPAHS